MTGLGKVAGKMVFRHGGAVSEGDMITVVLLMRASH